MNRRAFIRGATVLPIAGIAATAPDGEAVEISPSSYRTNPDHARLATHVAAWAGIPLREIVHMVVRNDHVVVSVLRRNRKGQPFLHRDSVAVRDVTVSGWFLPRDRSVL